MPAPRRPARTSSTRKAGPQKSALGVPVSHLYRGRVRLGLIRDLAMGEWSEKQIADDVGLPVEDIRDFQKQYANEIAETRLALAGELAIETAGLWITKRQNRLAELQQQAEDIAEAISDLNEISPIKWSRSHRDMYRARLDVFRAVADELGAYPQKSAPPARSGSTVHYVIESEDSEAMT